MKLGLSIKPFEWCDEQLAMCRQLGCEAVVAWMPLPAGDGVWHTDDLARLKHQANRHDLELTAIENLPPAHWDRILLGEHGRQTQIENVGRTIRHMGEVGILCLGYYFSIVGVWGHCHNANTEMGRGGAGVKLFDLDQVPLENTPPNQQVWFNTTLHHRASEGRLPPASHSQMWSRLQYFLEHIVPIAEEAHVVLAAHPEDPPVPVLRQMARPVCSLESLQRLVDMVPSPCNCLEFCQGTVAEMADTDVYAAIEQFGSQNKIAYVHFRNVRGRVPKFEEVFIDEGDVDMVRAIAAYDAAGFDGVLIPDHTSALSAEHPRQTGMAYALGYMRACMQAISSYKTMSLT